jgi:hypothetical protein
MLSVSLLRGTKVFIGRAGKEFAKPDAILVPRSRRMLFLCRMNEPYLAFRGFFPVTRPIQEFRLPQIPGYGLGKWRHCSRKCLF